MQLSYVTQLLPNPWPRLDDMATGNSSPTTTTSTHASIHNPSGTPLLFPSPGYHYKKKSASNLTTTDNTRFSESSGGNLTPKDVMHNGAGHIGKIHKANFSLPSFIGGAPIDTKRCDPSPRSASGASGRDLNQGPNQEHNLESGIQNKLLDALGPSHTLGRLRKSSSAMSLKLKIPRFSLKQQKNKDSMDAGHFSSASLSEDLPLSSNAVYRLGRMAFQRNGSVDSMSRSSKDGLLPGATHLPSRPATSMTLRNEETSAPPTPRTIAHRSSVLNLRHKVEDKPVLSRDTGPNSAEYRFSGIRRAHPTNTQDDLSINTHSAIGKYKSWRLNRRASLSATTNLMSFSESRPPSTTLKLDRCSKDDIEFPTRVNLGNSDIPECPTPSSSPMLKYSTEDLFIPTSLINNDMTIPPSNDTPFHHSKPPIQESTSTSTSRAPSSDSRVSTPELTSVSTHHTTSSISSYPQKNTPTQAQLDQWRKDAEIITVGLDDEFDGEVCVMRYEPRQSWFGFWNKESITDVIHGLRELRSPRT